MRNVWIVASNGSCSKIYKAENNEKLIEVKSFEHEESRLPTRDLVSDGKPGRSTERQDPRSFATQSKTPAKLKEKDHFAEEIALFLEENLNKGEFERLYLVANAQFISLLHHHFSPNVKKVVTAEVHKDLTKHSPEEIRQHLPPAL